MESGKKFAQDSTRLVGGATEVIRLDSSKEKEFWGLMQSEPFGWCFCAAWHVPAWQDWGDRTAEQNRQVREDLHGRGGHDGYLLKVDGQVVAWCQCGPRSRLPKLETQYRRTAEPPAHAITCFVVKPQWRGKGFAHKLLVGVLDDLRSLGVQRVEAYPRRGPGLEPGEVWTGPEALYEKAGFRIEVDHPERPILLLQL